MSSFELTHTSLALRSGPSALTASGIGGLGCDLTHCVCDLPRPKRPTAVSQKLTLLSPAQYEARCFPSGAKAHAVIGLPEWAAMILGGKGEKMHEKKFEKAHQTVALTWFLPVFSS